MMGHTADTRPGNNCYPSLGDWRPRATRSISDCTIRSTKLGKFSSSHDFSVGRSVSRTTSSRVGSCFRREAGECVDDRQHARLPTCRQLIMLAQVSLGRVEHMPCEVSSRRWSCLHRCRECLSRSHLRCVQHDGPADKPPIGDLLPRLGVVDPPSGRQTRRLPQYGRGKGMGQCEGGLLLRFYCLLHRRFTEKRRQPTLTPAQSIH
jgi:hypothetical protein